MAGPPDSKAKLPVAALLAVGLWGGSFPAVRVALEGFHPVGLTGLRLVMGTALLGLLLAVRGERLLPRRQDRALCALLGAILGVHLAIQAYGLRYTSAIHTGWIVGFMPATIAVGAHLFLKQRLSARAWVGVGVATAGVLLITLEELPDFSQARFGDLLQLSTCITWTLYTLLSVKVVEHNSAMSITGFAMAVASGVLLLLATTTGVAAGPLGWEQYAALFFLGLFCSGIAFTLWVHSQARHGTHATGLTLYAEPFFVLAISALLLGEAVRMQALVGGLTVLFGVWLARRGK